MVVHAENDKQKRVIASHLVTGHICKNCINYHKSVVFSETGYCSFFNKGGLEFKDFCSLYKDKNT